MNGEFGGGSPKLGRTGPGTDIGPFGRDGEFCNLSRIFSTPRQDGRLFKLGRRTKSKRTLIFSPSPGKFSRKPEIRPFSNDSILCAGSL